MIDGYVFRDDAEWEREAWAVANLLNVAGKRVRGRVTVKKLLGRGISPGSVTENEKQALWDAIQRSKPPDD